MVEVVTRRRGRMIRMGMIIADDPQAATARIIIRALILLRRDQVASLARLLSLIFSGAGFNQDICFALANAKKKPAALVRVSLFAVRFDLQEMFLFDSDCHFVSILFRS